MREQSLLLDAPWFLLVNLEDILCVLPTLTGQILSSDPIYFDVIRPFATCFGLHNCHDPDRLPLTQGEKLWKRETHPPPTEFSWQSVYFKA